MGYSSAMNIYHRPDFFSLLSPQNKVGRWVGRVGNLIYIMCARAGVYVKKYLPNLPYPPTSNQSFVRLS